MIKTPTTFIIGAGASGGYGLPTGQELHSQARDLQPQSDLFQLLLQSGVPLHQLSQVLSDLRNHPATSIDLFLESQQHRTDVLLVGRTIIAALMGRAISVAQNRPVDSNHDWLAYLIQKMFRGAPTWRHFADGNANVRFVTFNFDSVIEDRLTKDLHSIYTWANPPLDVDEVLKKCPILHVHGQLPPIPQSPMQAHPFNGFSEDWRKWILLASSKINVVLDSIPNETIRRAREAVTRAEIVCFLGFAYVRENLERLGLPLAGRPSGRHAMYGSAYMLPPGEQEALKLRLFQSKIELGGIHQNCSEMLRALPVFRD